jgi:hypothetical protein
MYSKLQGWQRREARCPDMHPLVHDLPRLTGKALSLMDSQEQSRMAGRLRPHPNYLDTASPNGGMAMNQGGRDETKADQGQARW